MEAFKARSSGWGYDFRRTRSKVDWAGVNMSDAFKPNRDYYVRLPAQRLFYENARVVQQNAARATGVVIDHGFEPAVKPQLSPFYTSYPSTLAAFASLGLTGFLEYSHRVYEGGLAQLLESGVSALICQAAPQVDAEIINRLVKGVSRCVHERLLLDELSRTVGLGSVEYYRLFLASQQDLQFRSVIVIVRSVVLFGDLLPAWRRLQLHGMTRALLRDLSFTGEFFSRRLEAKKVRDVVAFGREWVEALCRTLVPYLPVKREKDADPDIENLGSLMRHLADDSTAKDVQHRFGSPDDAGAAAPDRVPPVDQPRPPSLFDVVDLAEGFRNSLLGPTEGDPGRVSPEQPGAASDLEAALQGLAAAVKDVVEKQPSWEDVRSDLLSAKLRARGFERGPIQGTASEGHTVGVRLGAGEEMGEVFDRVVELSGDRPAYERLVSESAPVTQVLRRNLYPNLEQTPRTERFQACGSVFDPSRLPVAEVCGTPYRRYRVHEQLDRRGQPVLLIACDGSGSLNQGQMRMTKLLSCAWLTSTAGSRIQILAGLYHSGEVRRGLTGPLVQWMYHPRKTPATSRADAARAIVSFPERGTGRQSDAVSIAFMVDEALQVARGNTVYLILISDCVWNQCFPSSSGGKSEVASCLAALQADRGDRLHVTLVALGVTEDTGFEAQLDNVIAVSPEELEDAAAVAGRIGEYVAGCMRARRSLRGLN